MEANGEMPQMPMMQPPVAAAAPAKGKTLHQQTTEASKAAEAALRDTWGTPQKLFDELNAEVLALKATRAQAMGLPPPTVGFTVDVAAEQWNAKCPLWWGPGSPTGVVDALVQGNLAGHDWFCNPPFSKLGDWLRWAWRWYSAEARAAGMLAGIGTIIMPATRSEQEEWQKLIEPFRDKAHVAQGMGVYLETKFLTTSTEKSPFGRTKFVPPPGVKPSSPQFGTVRLRWIPL